MLSRFISIAMILAMFTGSARADLVAHWKFDEGSGDMAFDSSGNDYHAILVNNPEWVPGKIGAGALNMDAGGFGGIQGLFYQGSGFPELSVLAWIRTSSAAPQFIASFDRNEYWRFAIGSTNASVGAGLVGWHVQAGGVIDYASERRVDDGEWHHVGGVYDNGLVTVYIDGDPEPSATQGTTWGRGNLRYGYIGKNSEATVENQAGPGGNPLDGDIDDLRIYHNALTQAEILQVMKGTAPGLATDPSPEEGETDAIRDGVLGWEPGEFAQKHTVYFGTQFSDVNEASTTAPMGVLVSQDQDATTYDPGRLAFDQTYYWRVDEVNGAPDFTIFKGETWSFTVEPFSLPITDITATASSEFGVSVADKTIDGSGLVDDLHSTSAGDQWISTAVPASIAWAFDRAYKLHEMWVWNANQLIEAFIGFGAKDVVIEHSLDGENWTVLEGVSELAQAPGVEGYAANNIIDFGGARAQHVRMNINTVQGFAPQTSLSEVRFLYIPTFATGPNPVSGATDVAADVTLSWDRDGREAGRHDIYLGSDPNTLSLAGSVSESSFDTLALDLQLGQSYAWRVDEVNDAMDPSIWTGSVWNFTTVDAIVIDDMETYADQEFLEIWATWIDGFGDEANNGSLVGGAAGIPETGIVNGGSQSLPIWFDNRTAAISEATRTFEQTQDWTRSGVKTLVLSFSRGVENTGNGRVYVKVNDTQVVYPEDPAALPPVWWTQWTIDLSTLGADLTRVRSLTVGIEGAGARGVLYVDDIQLEGEASASPQELTWFEAEAADVLGASWRLTDDPTASGGRYIGSIEPEDGDDNTVVPTANWFATYNFNVTGGDYRVWFRAQDGGGDSFWVRITTATSQTLENPDQVGTGWVKFNSMAVPDAPDGWAWDEVHSNDHSNEVVNWTLAPGAHILEIAKREDGTWLDAIVITDDVN
ncbi:MAG: LamG domain-containing protein [Planctomycetes bacterium]|nr:LamG domain-containing protein [Planctomycetota bacterium]